MSRRRVQRQAAPERRLGPAAHLPPGDGTSVRIAALLIVLASLFAYGSSFRGVLVGDDVEAIVTNPHIRSLTPISHAASAPPDTTLAGRPVVALSFALNYALAPDGVRDAWTPADPTGAIVPPSDPVYRNLWGYHAANLLIHTAAALALFGVVRRTLLAPAPGWRVDVATAVGFSTALLWAAHPLTTAAVTYIVQRAEALMGLFLLLTVYCVLRAASAGGGARHLWTALAIVACALGMGSKETMVVAPVLAALWLWILYPGEALLSRERTPLVAGLASTWILLAILVSTGARTESVGFDLAGWTPLGYLRTQAAVIAHYLRIALVPSPLVFMYDWPPASSWTDVLPQLTIVVGLAIVTIVLAVRRHPAALPGAWFFLILAPSSSLLPIVTEVAAEHRMYLPLASVVLLVVLTGASLLRRAGLERHRLLALVPVGALALALGVTTHARSQDYWSVERLMQDTVAKRPQNVRARVVLGGHLLGMERFAEAESHLRAALAIEPHAAQPEELTASAHMYLGSALAAQGKLGEAIPHLERAIAMAPALGETYAFLGEAYASLGRMTQAAAAFRRAAEALPDVPPVLEKAARILATSPDPAVRDATAAVAYAERAVRLEGTPDLRTLDTLAAAYASQGRFADAVTTIERAMAIAQNAGDWSAMSVLETRLTLYRRGEPLREK